MTLSCFQVPSTIEMREVRGLIKHHLVTRLTPGPYISEREDDNGTYYRAAAGIVYTRLPLVDAVDATDIATYAREGGVFIPRAAGKKPSFYTFFELAPSPMPPAQPGATCASASVLASRLSPKLSAAQMAVEGGVGGATGALAARSTVRDPAVSAGRTAAAGAVGGAIAGAVIAQSLNEQVGLIEHHSFEPNAEFDAQLASAIAGMANVPSPARGANAGAGGKR